MPPTSGLGSDFSPELLKPLFARATQAYMQPYGAPMVLSTPARVRESERRRGAQRGHAASIMRTCLPHTRARGLLSRSSLGGERRQVTSIS